MLARGHRPGRVSVLSLRLPAPGKPGVVVDTANCWRISTLRRYRCYDNCATRDFRIVADWEPSQRLLLRRAGDAEQQCGEAGIGLPRWLILREAVAQTQAVVRNRQRQFLLTSWDRLRRTKRALRE